jgi:inner membrane protein
LVFVCLWLASFTREAGGMNKSLLLKAALVAALSLVLMVPVWMIRDLVAERQARRNEAVAGIAEGWGKRQTVDTPYLSIPYERRWVEVKRDTVDGKERVSHIERSVSSAVQIPASSVAFTVDAEVSERARGIYKARLYEARIRAQGTLEAPVRAGFEDGKSTYKWGTPRLVVNLSDARGVRAARDLRIDGVAREFAAGTGHAETAGVMHVLLEDLALAKRQTVAFSFSLDLGGSEMLSFSPHSADTAVEMRANWPHPSFHGRFLPARHEIGPQAFAAEWRVSRFASRDAGQISVSFIEPAGLYQQLERASKYGFLFLGLTFAAFMLFELLRRLAIHPVQYLLVGLALAMFFLLLTALSEHIAFATAYAIATVACVGVITAYLVYVLRSALVASAFGSGLAALYGMLYALLQAEDYSLLGGALLLFALLAALMLATRRVDWYQLRASVS